MRKFFAKISFLTCLSIQITTINICFKHISVLNSLFMFFYLSFIFFSISFNYFNIYKLDFTLFSIYTDFTLFIFYFYKNLLKFNFYYLEKLSFLSLNQKQKIK